jgi:hypothetical protein
MLYMREDDMDEALCQAAENYEVDAGKAADWNAVYNAVHGPERTKPVEEKKKKRRFIYWWLLLIPLGWIANTQFNKFNDTYIKTETKKPVAVEQKVTPNKQSSAQGNVAVDTTNTIAANKYKSKSNLNNKTFVQTNTSQQLISNNNFDDTLKNESSLLQSQELLKNQRQPEVPEQNKLSEQNKFNGIDVINSANPNSNPSINQQKNNSGALNNDTAAKQPNAAKNAKTSIKLKKSNSHYFYAGLMVGADLSFVKFQNMCPVGYNTGLMAGYKFNKLSIESGLYFVKKNYYTAGEYFDKTGIPYFTNAEVLSVEGYCNMFEIPLNVKYDISEKKNHAWFITAGVSSYLMNKEFYNYDYIKDGTQHYGSRAYYHASQNFFSVLNLSAGYQLKTGNKTNLRIEPYFKAPLTGVGTGKLSISSMGINAGITRRIH